MRQRWILGIAALVLAIGPWGCSGSTDDGFGEFGNAPENSQNGAGGEEGSGTGGDGGNSGLVIPDAGQGSGGSNAGNDDCADSAKFIYLVSEQKGLYAFDPNVQGLQAYRLIGTLRCPSSSSPQSMSVSRDGTAWIFYSDGKLFHVSTVNAQCTPTNYVHPVHKLHNMLGMGFTAVSNGSSQERLYVVSPDFGLATIDTGNLAVNQTGKFVGMQAELTGGPDAKLFMFAAQNAVLSEVDLGTMQSLYIQSFPELSGTVAWAFARYAGQFYLFTSQGGSSRTTIFDPATKQSKLRDGNIGFTVVGAGQSICVPPPPVR